MKRERAEEEVRKEGKKKRITEERGKENRKRG